MPDKIHSQAAETMRALPHRPAANVHDSALPATLPVRPVALVTMAGLLFLSGMCGLVFQICWFREFRLLFGASTAASSAVICRTASGAASAACEVVGDSSVPASMLPIITAFAPAASALLTSPE